MIKKIVATIMPALMLLPSCQAEDHPKNSLHHDPGRFTNDTDFFAWRQIDDGLYNRIYEKLGRVLPSDSPSTAKLQKWADTVRALMIKTDAGVSKIPKAIVRVIESNEASAFTDTVCVKVDVPFTLAADNSQRPRGEPPKYFFYSRGKPNLLANHVDISKCIDFNGTFSEKHAFAQWLFKGNQDCIVRAAGEGLAMDPAYHCPAQAGSGVFKGFITKIPHNYITVYSGLLERLDESGSVAVLAHELGHYYMAHDVALPGAYDFFYEIGEHNPGKKPSPLPPDHQLSCLGRDIQKYRQGDFGFVSVTGQSYHSLMFKPAENIFLMLKAAVESEDQGGPKDGDYLKTSCITSQKKCQDSCRYFMSNMETGFGGYLSRFPQQLKTVS
ncbi:MAG: M48 family metalloprotease [Oligoflexales bacterium]|nr:M48 family metalloprotease [Oligoflexales bacterium]